MGLKEQGDGGGEWMLIASGEETVVGKLDTWCVILGTSCTFTKQS